MFCKTPMLPHLMLCMTRIYFQVQEIYLHNSKQILFTADKSNFHDRWATTNKHSGYYEVCYYKTLGYFRFAFFSLSKVWVWILEVLYTVNKLTTQSHGFA